MDKLAERLIAKALSQSFLVIVLICVIAGLVNLTFMQREDKTELTASLLDCLKTSKKND
jgi:hypothetical protein